MNRQPLRITCAGLLLFFTLLLTTAPCQDNKKNDPVSKPAAMPETVSFGPGERATCARIIRSLESYHYSEKQLDDFLSSVIFQHYIEQLDPSKRLFTQQDLDEFKTFQYTLDTTLKKGDLSPGYVIFNRYLKRSFQRLTWLQDHLDNWETHLNFSKDQSIDLNREEQPWPDSEEKLASLWHKELKNSLLTLKLDEETSGEDITKSLERRYAARLNRLSQTDSKDAFRTYINAVTTCFDPHTQYFPPRASEDFDIQMSLSLEGIGAVLQSEFEYTKVVRLIPAGPADKSEVLMPGDKIIGVGQTGKGKIQDVVGWRIDEVVKLIRGPKDTIVRLSIIPAEKTGMHNAKTVSIKRDKVKLEEQAAKKSIVTVKRSNKAYKIGIIDIPTFYLDFQALQAGQKDYKSTTRDVRTLIRELKREGIDGLIVDVRDNGGGSLQEVNLLAGLFIESGPTVQIRDRSGYITRLKDPDPDIVYNGPLIVMVNRMSASASEIFAGAVKDYNRGVVVGANTFGKGTVQGLQPISQGQLKLTSAKFYRVSGKSTQNSGVMPDLEYPRIYNNKEIGEDSLKGALPWDKTKPARFNAYADLSPVFSELRSRHARRKQKNPDLRYLTEKFQLTDDLHSMKHWSLNETKRRKQKRDIEKRELALENKRRKARDLPPITSLHDLSDTGEEKERPDFLLKETERVMADFVETADSRGIHW
ncbi:MAG TPA: carboxy terminal-processing peptidase [Desulfobacteraceae bacterium]|nr:carboxy terminal-processing peptidase [Desulfobacteraceae bacterium]